MDKNSRNGCAWVLTICGAITLLIGFVVVLLCWREKRRVVDWSSYLEIRIGMSLDEANGILGEGEKVPPSALPGIVDFNGPIPRVIPAVKGQEFYKWSDGTNKIIVGIRDGSIVDKYYWAPDL
jgi:hypothetical protein